MSSEQDELWSRVRQAVVGRRAEIGTPFGRRPVVYADYTASGRAVGFIEDYLRRVLEHYGNTHTEDDATGIITTGRLHQAEATIKRLLGATERYKIIPVGAGTTAAVHRLQQILGIYIPPVAKDTFRSLLERFYTGEELSRLEGYLMANRPLVFVGPYEHHSNEVSWREGFAEVVEIELDASGLLDLEDLEAKLSRAEYAGRRKIGAFSAASNVSGVLTPVYQVARILHRHGALAFFDFAALAPYGRIEVCRDGESYFDGIYFSPHKFLGGPGASGILLIREDVYRADLPPTVSAGGTVDYVSASEQSYNPQIEVREKPGTPGIVQTLRAALALELKEKLGPERIEAREKELIRRALEKFSSCHPIEIMGNADPERRIAIFSFNVRAGASYLHPRFVTILLNDLFGIQSRAGCSCAGPYGHRVLHIDALRSLRFKDRLLHGFLGVKPGWARVNFHFLMTDEEFDYVSGAVCFVCRYGKYFLPIYEFDIHTGNWRHRNYPPPPVRFGLEEALVEAPPAGGPPGAEGEAPEAEAGRYRRIMHEALELAERLKRQFDEGAVRTTEQDLIPFVYV